MNWPDKLNALNTQLSDALNDAWALFESDTSACVAVLAEPFYGSADLAVR
jgi:enoyl-CoA hydratase/carnithine racemase